MTRFLAIMLCNTVAVVLLASALVLAQVPKAAVPQQVEAPMRLPAQLPRVAAPANAKELARQRASLSFRNQLLPTFRTELLYARTVGHLTKDQLRKIRPEADKSFQQTIEQLADTQLSAGQRQMATLKARATALNQDWRGPIRELVATAVKRHATAEQWSAYQADVQRRDAGRKEAGIRFLVAALDRQLMLSTDQRAKLTESFSRHWDDAWSSALALNLYGNTLVPNVPDPVVVPYLSNSQVKTWRGIQRFSGRFWGIAVDPGTDPMLDEELGAEPRPKKPVVPTTKSLKLDREGVMKK